MTPAKIRTASDADLSARITEMFRGSNEAGGLTRKAWNEYHRICDEQDRRKSLTGGSIA